MLTFFDYLRQRAFESVLAGAQDALQVLESRKNHAEPPAGVSNLPAPLLVAQAGPDSREPANGPTELPPAAEQDELLPAPRDRGRPSHQPKGK